MLPDRVLASPCQRMPSTVLVRGAPGIIGQTAPDDNYAIIAVGGRVVDVRMSSIRPLLPVVRSSSRDLSHGSVP